MFWLLITTLLARFVLAHSVVIDPNARECFHEQLKRDDRMTVSFQTDVGGDMQVNFWVTDPHNRVLHQQPRTAMGEYSLEAEVDGKYAYCFLNEGYDGQPREVSFNVHGVVYVSPDDPEHQDPLEHRIKELVTWVETIKDEQEYLVIRERVHRNTSESTNTRVKFWSIGQTVLLVGVCLFQVFYLKRFFEVNAKTAIPQRETQEVSSNSEETYATGA
ncbi:p24 complex component [Savitreella phatthalungensis]